MGIDGISVAALVLLSGEVTKEESLHKSIRACMTISARKNKSNEAFLKSLLQAHLHG